MKLIILIVVLVLLIIYYNNPNCFQPISEKFSNTISYFDNINQFDVEDVDRVEPIYIDGISSYAAPNDIEDSKVYEDRVWTINDNLFTDIFNNMNNDSCSKPFMDPNWTNEIFSCDGGNIYSISSKESRSATKIANDTNKPIKGGNAIVNVTPKPKNIVKENFYETSSPTTVSTKKVIVTNPKNMNDMTMDMTSITDTSYNYPKSDKYPSQISINNSTYYLLGYATNPYYEQYYLLYENEVINKLNNPEVCNDLKYLNFRLFQYILVKMRKDIPVVKHIIAPRTKINIGDNVYLSLGVFQLGPLAISTL
jgi:hypothetical protein